MAIQSNFPAIKPTLLLDFANTEQLDPRITFTRASTATYYGTQTAKAEENLLTQSQTFDTASWGPINTTVTANTNFAPDGTPTSETFTDDAISGSHLVQQILSVTIDTTYVFSCFLKAGTNNYAYLSFRDSVTGNRYFSAEFDLSTGAVNRTSAGSSGTLTTQSITAVGSGWYRCVIIGQVAAAGSMRAVIGLSDGTSAYTNLGVITYTGTGTSIFAWGAQLEQRSAVSAYTATTTQPITNYVPVLLTAASGVARFDHNPTTFESLGLLIEESRTNLFTYSEQFDNGWNKAAATITANTIVSPDGTLDADKLVEDATTAIHNTAVVASVTSGTTYTASFYAKKAERTQCGLLLATAGFGTNTVDTFDLDAGTVITNASGTAAITAVGNDWYRVSSTRTATATSSSTFQIRIGDAGSFNYLGDGYSGIYIWGAQLEAGAFATSYIPTVASQVTRAADAASMTGTNFSSWYNAGQGTLYSEASVYDVSSARNAFVINDGTTSNRILTGHGANPKGFIATGATTQMSQSITTVTFSANTFSKVSLAYADNNGNAAANGSIGTLDTAMTIPVVTQLQIGAQTGSAATTLNGRIKKLAYYPIRCTDAQLQALTS